jgi:hypothetical protein
MKTLKYIGIIIAIIVAIFIFSFVRSCNDGFGYQAGSGLGSLVDIGHEKYKSKYLAQYVDTFFKIYPKYRVDSGDFTIKNMTSSYDFLHLTNIHFDNYPKETYCVQWSGTGFISVRFAYNYEINEEVVENPRNDRLISDSIKDRMTQRLRTEVLDRIDSIISKSKDSTVAIDTSSL